MVVALPPPPPRPRTLRVYLQPETLKTGCKIDPSCPSYPPPHAPHLTGLPDKTIAKLDLCVSVRVAKIGANCEMLVLDYVLSHVTAKSKSPSAGRSIYLTTATPTVVGLRDMA